MALTLKAIPGSFAVCRLPPGSPLPHWFRPDAFASVSWSAEELSLTCDESHVPDEVQCERGWRCLVLQGPFEFHLTGILLQVLAPLAAAGIGIFAVSTFDTDYVLVKDAQYATAKAALRADGLQVLDP